MCVYLILQSLLFANIVGDYVSSVRL